MQIFLALQFGTAILIGIALAKSGLPTELISIYEAWMFLSGLFCFFWVSGGLNTLLQLFPRLDESQKGTALFNVFLLFALAGLVSGGALFFTKGFITQHLTNFTELPWLNWLALFIALNSPTLAIQIFYLLLKKYREIIAFGLASFSLQIVAVASPIYLGMGLREVMIGLIAWAAFKFIWLVALMLRHARWQWDDAFFKAYLPLAAPLLLLAFIGKGADYAGGLMVSLLFEDEKSFAVFRYGAREFPIAVMMVGALAISLLAEVSENREAGLQRIKSATRKLSHLLFPLSMASMAAAPILFPIVFNSDFKESARLFNIFTLLLSSRILMPQVVAMSRQKNYILSLGAAVELLTMIGLSWWWGLRFGLEGIAFAAVAAFILERIILIEYNRRVLKVSPKEYIDWPTYLVYNGLMVAVFLGVSYF